MKKKIIESDKIKKEIGLAICNIKGKLIEGTQCYGEEYELIGAPITRCPKGKLVGLFHTHHEGIGIMSPSDLVNTAFQEISCIGVGKTKEIVCYFRKSDWLETLEGASKAYEYYDKILSIDKDKEKKEIEEKYKRLIERHFDKIVLK